MHLAHHITSHITPAPPPPTRRSVLVELLDKRLEEIVLELLFLHVLRLEVPVDMRVSSVVHNAYDTEHHIEKNVASSSDVGSRSTGTPL
jgi:hypothetical protein